MKKAFAIAVSVVALIASASAVSVGVDTERAYSSEVSFLSCTKAELKRLNPCLYRRIAAAVPLYAATNGTNVLGGQVTVTITTANKITAKAVGLSKKSAAFTISRWEVIDTDDGTVSAAASKGDNSILMSLHADGLLSASVLLDGIEYSGSVWTTAAGGDFSAFAGIYTVALPCILEEGDCSWFCGSAYLTLKISSVSAECGTASFTCMLPDSTKATSKVTMAMDRQGRAQLPIFVKSGNKILSLPLMLVPQTGGGVSVCAIDGMTPFISNRQSSYSYVFYLDVVGGRYSKGSTPLSLCQKAGKGSALDYSAEGAYNHIYLTATSSGFLQNYTGRKGFTITIDKSTGVISGTGLKTNCDGSLTAAKFSGVVVAGELDELFAMGIFYWKRGYFVYSSKFEMRYVE